jgi:beta-lactamase class A
MIRVHYGLEEMMTARKKWVLLIVAALILWPSTAPGQEKQGAEDKTLRLAIGDAQLKNRVLRISADGIVSARTGKPLSFEQMIKDMKASRFVYVGESHDNMAMHDIQLKVIQGLFKQDPHIAVGLEMLPADCQPALDRWSQGLLSEDELISEVRWYVHWNLNFGYYKKIFEFARDNKIPLVGLNAPRDVITKIRMNGWESLSDEEKKLAPRPDLSDQDHRALIRTIFESSEIPHAMMGEALEKMFEGLYRAQSAWDEVMAANAVRGAERDGRRMIVLAGSGHLLYNLGINRRVSVRNRLPFRTVVAVELAPEERSLDVSASFADFVWGIPEQERPAFPAVGLALKKVDGLDNIVVERKPIDGVALSSDIEKGDIFLTVDGRGFSDINQLRTYLADVPWSGEVKFRLLRGGEARDLALKFEFKPRREMTPGEKKAPDDKMKAAPAAARRDGRIGRLQKRIEDTIKEKKEGEVGVALKHLESGRGLGLNAGSSFPMASTFKLPVLVEVMAQVKEGRFSLDDELAIQKPDQHLGSGLLSSLTAPGIKLTVRNLANLMMMISDNSAADILLAKVGAENVNKRLREFGIEGLSVNRSCQELIMDRMGMDYRKFKSSTLEEIEAEFRTMPERDAEADRESVRRFDLDPRDQSTPAAMNRLLEKIHKKEILDPESCDLILAIMLQCQTGQGRIKGELPPATPVAHKTGTIAGTFNDTGIITLPDNLGHLALTVFTKGFEEEAADVESLIAEIARLAYDYFVFTEDASQGFALQ